MRQIPKRAQRLLTELRNDVSPRYYDIAKTADEVRRDAREALARMSYVGKPIKVGPALAEKLRR